MRRSSIITMLGATTALVVAAAGRAEARIDVEIDKAAQKMSVYQNGSLRYVWPAATFRDGYAVPDGTYVPERLERSVPARGRDAAAMPHAIFLRGGYAIHGSDNAKFGEPACQGCVRLHRGDAALLFSMVKDEGPGNTVVYVGGNGAAPQPYGGYEARPRPAADMGGPRGMPPGSPPAGRPPYGGEPPMPPYPGRQSDGRDPYQNGADPGGWDERPPPGLRLPPDYVDPFQEGPRAPRTPADYRYGGDGRPRDYGDPWGDERAARGPRLPPDYVDPFREDAGRGPRPSGYDPYRDGRDGPRGPRPPEYGDSYRGGSYRGDAYRGDSYRDTSRGPRLPPDYDPYREGRPRGPGAPSDYDAERYGRRDYPDPWQEGRPGPRSPGAPPDYRGDGYDRRPADFRGDPRASGGDMLDGPYAPDGYGPDRRGSGRGADLRDPSRSRGPDGRSEGGQRGGQPPARNVPPGPPPRADGWRNDTRPPPWPQQQPPSWPGGQGRSQDRPQERSEMPMQPPSATPTSGPPPAGDGSDLGYRVLPQSYWRGSSWRWRPGGDDDRLPQQ